MATRAARWMVFAISLWFAGCCGREAQVALETEPLALPVGAHATGIPAHWLLTPLPGEEIPSPALEVCADRGRVGQLPLTYSVVEVSPQRVVVAGESVVNLDQGHLPEGVSASARCEAVVDAVVALQDAAHGLALAGCRPWDSGDARPPEEFRDQPAPPVLVALDRGLPLETGMGVLDCLLLAGVETVLLWIDDATPAPAPSPGAGDDVPQQSDVLTVVVGGPGEPLGVALNGANLFPGADGLVSEESFREGLDGALGKGSRPTGLLVASGGGTVADLVGPWDTMAGADVHCTVVAKQLWMESSPGGVESDGAGPRTIARGDTLAVLPVLLPRVRARAVAWEGGEERAETLITGHRCPETSMVVRPVPMPSQGP